MQFEQPLDPAPVQVDKTPLVVEPDVLDVDVPGINTDMRRHAPQKISGATVLDRAGHRRKVERACPRKFGEGANKVLGNRVELAGMRRQYSTRHLLFEPEQLKRASLHQAGRGIGIDLVHLCRARAVVGEVKARVKMRVPLLP
ncbi:hypothetical protein AN901_204046 [Pseudomonas syringae pv. theae]|nr:hypothetical protein AN901_204046 [Pseudomonas syringae pv. theae]